MGLINFSDGSCSMTDVKKAEYPCVGEVYYCIDCGCYVYIEVVVKLWICPYCESVVASDSVPFTVIDGEN